MFALTAEAASAAPAVVTCPVVDPGNGAVTPAPKAGVDWTGCNLSNANLSGADLAGATLAQATLTNANLQNAKMAGISLAKANLTGAFLKGVDLSSANLSGANLSKATISNANLNKANLAGATLTGVQGRQITGTPAALPVDWFIVAGSLVGPGANLANDNLSGAALAGRNLVNTQFDGANLSGADLSRSNLNGSSLQGTILTGANLDGTSLATGNLTGVVSGGITGIPLNLPINWALISGYLVGPGANLTGANLGGLQLSGVDLAGANLQQANLAGADLAKANLSGANMTSANLTGADLFHAVLNGIIWSSTACPNGTNSNASSTGCSRARAYRFSGLGRPAPGSSVRKSAHTFSVRFRLTGFTGKAISSDIAQSLTNAHEVRATLRGPGISAVNASCHWNSTVRNFRCTVHIPGKVKTGKSHKYTVTEGYSGSQSVTRS